MQIDTQRFKENIQTLFSFNLSDNQSKDLLRLFHEIKSIDGKTADQIITILKNCNTISNSRGKDIFLNIKKLLLEMRYPLTAKQNQLKQDKIYLSKLQEPVKSPHPVNKLFIPDKIFIEKKAKNTDLCLKLVKKFPNAEINYIDNCIKYIKKNRFELKDLKKPWVFIVKENWDFIKPCPCTKDHIGCNYWIFNLGFGCPFDCSYCFLQQYSNFPGIVIPANMDDFFAKFDDFHKKLKAPIRIGTGEFCDSLALDHITGFATRLINYFKDKDLFFELKTKSDNISNILKIEGKKNIVISWSLNPQEIIKTEELLAASLKQRLEAAEKVQAKGFSIAFHFDPR